MTQVEFQQILEMINRSRSSLKEKLKGNQHKIDMNKNGKIDAEDFMHLRKKTKPTMEEAELDEGSMHAARPRNASRPGTEPAKKGSLQDRIMAARARIDAKKKDVKEEVEDVAEASNGLYQKAIRKHAERVAHDYLGGGDEHLYGANKFDAEMHGVSRERANKDFKTLFNKIVSSQAVSAKKKDVKEGVEHNYTVKRTHSVKEPGELDSSTKRHHYDIHKDGKKVGELEHGEYFGDVNGKLHGKDLPSLGSYRGSHPESKLHSFLNSKTGTKWASNLHKYQKEEAKQIDELNKDTVYSYNKKSISATGKLDKQLSSQIRSGNASDANKTAHKLNKRLAGQERADARLNKEEAEQVDEVSMDYLRKKDYLRKAEASRKDAENTTRQYWKSPEEKQKARETVNKRDKGIGAYTDRLYKTMKKPEYKTSGPEKTYPLGGYDPKSNRSYSE